MTENLKRGVVVTQFTKTLEEIQFIRTDFIEKKITFWMCALPENVKHRYFIVREIHDYDPDELVRDLTTDEYKGFEIVETYVKGKGKLGNGDN